MMRHRLKISVSRKPRSEAVVTCRNLSIRERLLRLLFGDEHKVTVLIPGDNVKEIAISDAKEGEEGNGKLAGGA